MRRRYLQEASLSGAQSFFITIIVHQNCDFRIHHCTGIAGKGEVMSILSKKSAFILAAAVISAVSMSSFAASAGPLVLKKPCIGCNPNTWTPGNHNNNHWNAGYGFAAGLAINLAQAAAADTGDCYYVRRQVFIPQVGVVSKRQLVCN
jgi:hypothetical protein